MLTVRRLSAYDTRQFFAISYTDLARSRLSCFICFAHTRFIRIMPHAAIGAFNDFTLVFELITILAKREKPAVFSAYLTVHKIFSIQKIDTLNNYFCKLYLLMHF